MRNDYESLSHTKWRCQYHIVITPKYRRQAIYGKYKIEIGKILRTICERYDVEIVLFHAFNFSVLFETLFERYRVDACDGTYLNIIRNPNDKKNFFQSNTEEKGFNLLHLNVLYDLCGKRYLGALIRPDRQENEFCAICQTADRFSYSEKVVYIADRGYESNNVFAYIERKSIIYLIRVKDKQSSELTFAYRLITIKQVTIQSLHSMMLSNNI